MTTAPHPPPWRSPRSWPLRTRLVAIMIGLLAMLGLLVGGTAQVFLHKTLYDRLDDRLAEATGRAVGPVGPGIRRTFFQAPPPGAQNGSIVLFVTPDSAVRAGGMVEFRSTSLSPGENIYQDLPDAAVERLVALAPTGRPVDVDLGDLGNYRAAAHQLRGGPVLITALPLAETENTLFQVGLVIAGGLALAMVAAGWAGAVIIRRTLQPLDRVAATATRVAELQLDRGRVDIAQRVPAGDTDPHTEVGQVGAALNRMLDHVGNALDARHASEMQVRQFVADASHELRTPLATIRGYAELSRRSRQPVPEEIEHVLRRVESEAQRMTTLVEDLLLLARLDAGRPLAHDPVDLTVLAVDAVSDAHAAGPRHDWQLDVPDEPVTVLGDAARLHQVLGNLLANARTHTPEGTTVTVGVAATGSAALIRVTDTGPGIPPELRPHIFERFARGDSSRSRAAGSTGLGLSIVHAVVTAHGGTVGVESAPGRTEFTVRLPRSVGAPDPVHQDIAQVVQ